ncbi:hypothetical protein ACJ72_01565 [Emergomyces africanus]|uniref:Uncharacterized protein n=1 Tax=Emergomyces africanus TaxID=1955775 RepID=A0A1B7P4U2_9EURO|nr:hypothetical protein ACJ72_01565 [Emergomyces africanus]
MAIQKRIQKLLAIAPKDASGTSIASTPAKQEKSPRGKDSATAGRIPPNGNPDLNTTGGRKRKVLAEWNDGDEDSTYGSRMKRQKPGKLGNIKLEKNDATVND